MQHAQTQTHTHTHARWHIWPHFSSVAGSCWSWCSSLKWKWNENNRGAEQTLIILMTGLQPDCVLLCASYASVHTLVDNPQQLSRVIKGGSCDWLVSIAHHLLHNETHMRLFCIFPLGRYRRGFWPIFVQFVCFITECQLITQLNINVVFPIYTGTPGQQPSEKKKNQFPWTPDTCLRLQQEQRWPLSGACESLGY